MTHFTRTLPITGDTLFSKHVALLGVGACAAIAELLACSGVLRWLFLDEAPAAQALAQALCLQHGEALPWHFACSDLLDAPHECCDLLIVAGDQALLAQGLLLAQQHACPLLHLPPAQPEVAGIGHGFVVERVPAADEVYRLPPQPQRDFAAAAIARALLLRGTPQARPDIEQLLRESAPRQPLPSFATPESAVAAQQAHLLIIGCGSLGSLVAHQLAPLVGHLTLVDGGTVSAYNPVRQLYPATRIGQPKAYALRDELLARHASAVPEMLPLQEYAPQHEAAECWAYGLAARAQPTLALLLTGTPGDLALARGLRAAAIPHIVGRCYPRARYWEGIVLPDPAAPCLGCLRGQLYTGPHAPPTPEEAARYTTAGALDAEPATRVESGWAAACIAALAQQLLVPPGLREYWFLAALEAHQTCFIGGAYALASDNTFAYGIARPGQVRAYGLHEIVSSAAERICSDCGRSWPTRYLV